MTVTAGDVLLYRPSGLFGRLIALKTWNEISHVEVSIGGGFAVASRDGKGVNVYPERTAQLAHVLRPVQPFDLAAAMAWFEEDAKGLPYGWLDIAAFLGLKWDAKGVICSPFATDFLRAGGLDPFNGYPSRSVAPFMFRTSPVFVDVTESLGV